MMQNPDDLLTVQEAGELLGGKSSPLHASTIYRMVRSGALPAPVKVSPGITRWRRGDLLGALESRGQRTSTKTPDQLRREAEAMLAHAQALEDEGRAA